MSFGGAKETCSTGMYTHSGECCKACNLGEGVAQPCGANQTVCEPCLDSESLRVAKGEGLACTEQSLKGFCLLAGSLPTSVRVPDMGGIQSRRSREGLNG